MSNLREQIYATWDLRETDDLLAVWQRNDRVDWSDEVFEVIEEILKKRGLDIPQQNSAIPTYETKKEKEIKKLSELELKISSRENQPEFYNPVQVFKVCKWLNIAAKIMVALAVLSNALYIPSFIGSVKTYLYQSSSAFIVLVTALMMGVGLVINALIYYFPLVALSHILRILMEMDFNNRKAQ